MVRSRFLFALFTGLFLLSAPVGTAHAVTLSFNWSGGSIADRVTDSSPTALSAGDLRL